MLRAHWGRPPSNNNKGSKLYRNAEKDFYSDALRSAAGYALPRPRHKNSTVGSASGSISRPKLKNSTVGCASGSTPRPRNSTVGCALDANIHPLRPRVGSVRPRSTSSNEENRIEYERYKRKGKDRIN